MRNLINLVKINLLTFFDIYKLFQAKENKEFKKVIPYILLYIYIFGVLTVSIYYASSFALDGLKTLGLEHLLLVVMMVFTSIYLVFTTVFKVNKTLFGAKDYSILFSLPIEKNTIITSKFIVLYLANLIFMLIFMIPTYLAYILGTTTSYMFHIMFFVSFLFIPLIPTVVGCIIGSLLTALSARFKYKNFANIIFSLLLFVVVYYFTYNMQNLNALDLANLSQSIVNKFNSIYPVTKLYTNIIGNYDLFSLIIFIFLSLFIFVIFKNIIVKYFANINNKLSGVTINNKYIVKNIKLKSPLMSLYQKEIKRYISSALYVLNTAIGSILLLATLILLAVLGSDTLDAFIQMPNFSQYLMTSAPLVFAVFTSLSCTTHSSISLEGKNLWILKSLPVNIKNIFIAKIMVNLTIILPTILIASLILMFIIKLSILNFLVLLILPTIYAFFIAGFGLLINLFFPLLDWVNEVKVIKQSMASFLTIITGLIVSVVPIFIIPDINPNKYFILTGTIMLIITSVIYKVLFTKGVRIFKSL
ncbi:MAG: hypothetical protein PHX04_03065 [Bacilli bacterium]|nr:hypothetical protein [Bacilli bacterium]